MTRQTAQEVCPWNVKFARELRDGSPFAPRPFFEGRDARSLALELLAMSSTEYTSAFRGSPMKRSKLVGLRRNAAVMRDNVGSSEDVPALVSALSDPEPVLRLHAAWALGRLATASALVALRERLADEPDESVRRELLVALDTSL